MNTHPIDAGLRALGVDPDSLDPEVLSALRHADRPTTLEDAYAGFYAPGAEDQRRKQAETKRQAILSGRDHR